MRKFVMSLVMVLFMAGLVCAVEVTVLKYNADKKEVTVKEGEKEHTYKITDDTKVVFVDKDGNTKDGKLTALTKRLENLDKAKGKVRLNITTDKDTITEVKMTARKKKN